MLVGRSVHVGTPSENVCVCLSVVLWSTSQIVFKAFVCVCCRCMAAGGIWLCVCASVWVHGGHLCISMVSRLFGECQRSFALSFRTCVRLVSGCARLSQNIIQDMCVV